MMVMVCRVPKREGQLQVQQVSPAARVSHGVSNLLLPRGMQRMCSAPGDVQCLASSTALGLCSAWPPSPLSEQQKQGHSHLVFVLLCLQRPLLKSQLPWGGSGCSPELSVSWQSCCAPRSGFSHLAHKSPPW